MLRAFVPENRVCQPNLSAIERAGFRFPLVIERLLALALSAAALKASARAAAFGDHVRHSQPQLCVLKARSRSLLALANPCTPICHRIATTAPFTGCSRAGRQQQGEGNPDREFDQ